MRFALATEQLDFAAELRKVLDAGQVPAAVRAWAGGDTAKGTALLRQVAEMGVFSLIVDEQYDGADATAVDLVVAMIELGRAAAPGPVIESAAVIPALLQRLPDPAPAQRWLPELAGGALLGTVGLDRTQPDIALDADTAELVLVTEGGRVAVGRPGQGSTDGAERAVAGGQPTGTGHAPAGSRQPDDTQPAPAGSAQAAGTGHAPAGSGQQDDAQRALANSEPTEGSLAGAGPIASIDPARKLFRVGAGETVADDVEDAIDYAFDVGVLACAAQLLGAGRAILDQTTTYAKQRKQFGRVIGEFQAVKQQLADVLIALDLAEPLVYRAALTLDSPDRARDVSAALVACGDAAHRAARAGLQIHGAIGYTAECDLSLWLTRVAALRTAWGTADFHRARIAAALRTPATA